jgi:hypothetical protein
MYKPQSLTQAKGKEDNLGLDLFLPNQGTCFEVLRISELNPNLTMFHVNWICCNLLPEVWLGLQFLVRGRTSRYKKRSGVPIHPSIRQSGEYY